MRSLVQRWFSPTALVLLLLLPVGGQAAAVKSVILPDLPDRAERSDADKAAAKRAYGEVEQAWGRGDLGSALGSADEAFRAVPNASTAILRATVLGAMNRPDEAFAALLVASDLGPTPEERTAIDQGLAQHGAALAPPAGWARVTVEPGAADVTIDGVRLRAPRTVGLTVGAHALHIAAPGYGPQDVTLDVPAVQAVAADYRLVPEPAPPVEPPPAPEPDAVPLVEPQPGPEVTVRSDSGSPWSPVLPWVLLGGGVALVATGGGMHAWAVQAADDTSKYAEPVAGLSDDERRSRFDQANEDMQLRGTLAYVFYGVGGAAAVTGAVLLILDATRAEPAPVAVLPSGEGGAAGLQVLGRF